jgi:hypothetical protein
MPSFPAGSAIFGVFFTIWNYIIKYWTTVGRARAALVPAGA